MKFIDSGAAIHDLYELDARITEASVKALRGATKDGVDSAKATSLFKDQTGKTRKSIRSTVDDYKVTSQIRAGGAASLLESGTGPHEITAKGGGLLKFMINGQWVSKKSVNHQGTVARPFMTVAADIAERSLDYYSVMFVESAIDHE